MKKKIFKNLVSIFTFTFVLFLFTVSHVKANENPSISEHEARVFNGAYKIYESKDYKKVIETLQEYVVNQEKTHPFAYTIYALACVEVKQYNLAIKAFEKALKHYPKNYELKHNYAVTLMSAKKYLQAANLFVELIGLAPNEAKREFRYSAAQAYFLAKKYTLSTKIAIPLLNVAKPKKAHIELVARIYAQTGNLKEANKYYTLFIQHYPTDFQAWSSLSHIRYRQNNLSASATALELANRISPTRSNVRSTKENLAIIYSNINALRLEMLTLNSLTKTKDRENRYLYAMSNSSNKKDFFSYINNRINNTPNSELYFVKGLYQYRLLELENAKTSFYQGYKLGGPESERCLFLVALINWEQGNLIEAAKHFNSLETSQDFKEMAMVSLTAIELIEKEKILIQDINFDSEL